MIVPELPPFLPFLLAAVLLGLPGSLLGRLPRALILLGLPLLSGLNLIGIAPGDHLQWQLLGLTLHPFRVDALSLLFGYLFHLAAFLGGLYALHLKDPLQDVAAMAYAGSALGAVFAGDLLTLFLFWELMAVSSVFLVWARRREAANRSGLRYLLIQIGSGLLLLAGIVFHYQQQGELHFEALPLEGWAGWLIFLAFGIKCAFPLLHNWLTDAYPEATPTGTVFLSAFTTKTAVYCLARGFPGEEILIYIGAAMTAFPIFYAVIENDLRRVLAYSMINQVGFMVCGIGIGTALALNGAVAHAFNDVIFKGLLFMSMGAVLHRVGNINGSELGGLYRSMPWTTGLCIVGAASISAFPLFSGFVSKSMVMSAALEQDHGTVWLVLLFASAGVFHHAGIKIPFFAFFAHDSGLRPKEAPANMLAAMGLSAVLCIAIGLWPQALYQLLPWEMHYNPYDASHVLAQTQLLFFSALAFAWLKLSGLYPPELRSVNLDAEWLYRRAAPALLQPLATRLQHTDQAIRQTIAHHLRHAVATLGRHQGPQGRLARNAPTRSMVLWVAILLLTNLVLYYL